MAMTDTPSPPPALARRCVEQVQRWLPASDRTEQLIDYEGATFGRRPDGVIVVRVPYGRGKESGSIVCGLRPGGKDFLFYADCVLLTALEWQEFVTGVRPGEI